MARFFRGLVAAFALMTVSLSTVNIVSAVDIWGGGACKGANTDLCSKKGSKKSTAGALGPIVKSVVDILLYISVIVSVIVIIVSGIKYASSTGDSGKVTSAKNTLLYAVVGLLVSVMSLAIIQYAYDKLR